MLRRVDHELEEAPQTTVCMDGDLTAWCGRGEGNGRFGKAENDDHPGSPLPGTPLIFHLQRGPTGLTKWRRCLYVSSRIPTPRKVSKGNRESHDKENAHVFQSPRIFLGRK